MSTEQARRIEKAEAQNYKYACHVILDLLNENKRHINHIQELYDHLTHHAIIHDNPELIEKLDRLRKSKTL